MANANTKSLTDKGLGDPSQGSSPSRIHGKYSPEKGRVSCRPRVRYPLDGGLLLSREGIEHFVERVDFVWVGYDLDGCDFAYRWSVFLWKRNHFSLQRFGDLRQRLIQCFFSCGLVFWKMVA